MKRIFLVPIIISVVFSCSNAPKEEVAKKETAPEVNIVPTSQNTTATTKDTNEIKNYKVKLSTTYGDMIIQLSDETPQHRDNFIKLAKQGYFNDLLFHRVIKGFMLQGGDPDSKTATPTQMLGQGGPGYTVPAEMRPDLFHQKGALCAARQGDNVNPQKASSGSQFYIVQGKKYTDAELDDMQAQTGVTYSAEQRKVYKEIGGTPFLDQNYTVFGQVIEGLDVIDKIAAVQTMRGDRPVADIKMTITVVE